MNFIPFQNFGSQPAGTEPQTSPSAVQSQSTATFSLLAAFVDLVAPAIAYFGFRKPAAPAAQLQIESDECKLARFASLEVQGIDSKSSQAKIAFLAKLSRELPHSYANAIDAPPQPDSASDLVFDADAALARVEGNRRLLRNMIVVFAAQWNNLVAEIVQAGKRRDGATLEWTARKLTESLASFGADEASHVAQDLEARGRRRDFHDVGKTCGKLNREVERLVHGLEEFSKPMCACVS